MTTTATTALVLIANSNWELSAPPRKVTSLVAEEWSRLFNRHLVYVSIWAISEAIFIVIDHSPPDFESSFAEML